MLQDQGWTRSSSNITLRRVRVRGLTVGTVLPRYRDRSSSVNNMLVRYHARVLGPITQISVTRVLRYPRWVHVNKLITHFTKWHKQREQQKCCTNYCKNQNTSAVCSSNQYCALRQFYCAVRMFLSQQVRASI